MQLVHITLYLTKTFKKQKIETRKYLIKAIEQDRKNVLSGIFH